MEEHALRPYIRAKLEHGHLLPYESVSRVWGGPGNGETCNGCEETVAKGQLRMECLGTNGDEVRLHVKCFYVWAAEQTDLTVRREPRERRTTFSGAAPSHAPPPGTPVAGP